MQTTPGIKAMVYFDIGDTLFYLSHHSSVSGIQRVVIETWKGIEQSRDLQVVPVVFNPTLGCFSPVSKVNFEELLLELEMSNSEENISKKAKSLIKHSQSADAIVLQSPAVLLILGAAWTSPLYFSGVNKLKDQGIGVLALIYDLIPILSKSFPQASKLAFTSYVYQLLMLADRIAAISMHTRLDLQEFAHANSLSCPPGGVTRLPGGFANKSLDSNPASRLLSHNYILMVGTIEERKNHLLALRAYQQVLDEFGISESPNLVLVGRYGWNVKEFLDEIERNKILSSKVIILANSVTDAQLANLYKNALFTIYPSLYEGWGLPVSESLDFGVPVIASNTSSIPEAGESFAVYIDPTDENQLAQAMMNWISNDKLLNEQRKLIASRDSLTWKDVASVIIDEVSKIEIEPRKYIPVFDVDIEYGFGSLGAVGNVEDGLVYRKEIQRRRSLPMTNRIPELKDIAFAEFSLDGPNKSKSEFGISFSTDSQSMTVTFSFARSVADEVKVIVAVDSNHNKLRLKSIHEHGFVEEIFTSGTTSSVTLLANPIGHTESITFIMESLLDDTTIPLMVNFSSAIVTRPSDTDSELTALKMQQRAQLALTYGPRSVDARDRLLEEKIKLRDERIRSFESSLSWRITSPIRAMGKLLKMFF